MEAKSVIPELPTEIIFFQILPRLPTKFVLRCRCVCKSWSSLTRDPSFLAVHRSFRCSPSTHLLFTASNETNETKVALHHFYSVKLNEEEEMDNINQAKHLFSLPAPPRSFLDGTHCINGLIILAGQKISPKPVYVHNPCTKEMITLPRANLIDDLFTQHLGFSVVTNEYKVLQVRWSGVPDGPHYEKTLRFKIFTLGTASWRDIKLDFPFDPQRLHFERESVCLNGGIHWMHMNEKIIVVFDVAAERFRDNVPLPGDFNFGNIIEVGGCVAVYDRFSFYQENNMLWILEDYENHVWVKKTIVFPSCWLKLGCPFPLGTIHTGEILLRPMSLDSDDNCVLLYNMESNSFRKCKISLPVNNMGPYPYFLTSYDETSVISLRS